MFTNERQVVSFKSLTNVINVIFIFQMNDFHVTFVLQKQ